MIVHAVAGSVVAVFAAIDPAWAEPINNFLLIILVVLGANNRQKVKEAISAAEEATATAKSVYRDLEEIKAFAASTRYAYGKRRTDLH